MAVNNQTLPVVDQNTNRIQTGQGYSYDANGNLIQDYAGRQFTFDGDNKQTVIKDASNNPIGRYYYAVNGTRVKKVTNSETVIFIYDGTGKLVAEYSTATPTQHPTTNYTATDPLGSPRVVTNSRKEIVSRRDFLPFGEELAPDSTYRTANLKYGTDDTIRQKFTGYQRDEETQLDFAEARYYNNAHGRFTAVDPLLASGKSANPQTFNRYAYTMNRPLILTDSTGLQVGTELKRDFNLTGQTYKIVQEAKPATYAVIPGTTTRVQTAPETPEQIDSESAVSTNEAVNEVINKYASAIYTNEFNANSAIGGSNEAAGTATVKSVTLGTGIDFGLVGKDAGNVSGSASISITVDINNNESIDAQRRDADTKLNGDARNKLRNIKTVAAGSPDTPRNLTENEISGMLQSAATTATIAARKDVEAAEQERKKREQTIPPRQ